mmetsp:Transcript_30181/g.30544  ORF Transcript_30181/g.30544 Transcript_30181/m.30544 type:complete len:91 (-) Transcript_30181:392-664(-)
MLEGCLTYSQTLLYGIPHRKGYEDDKSKFKMITYITGDLESCSAFCAIPCCGKAYAASCVFVESTKSDRRSDYPKPAAYQKPPSSKTQSH